MKEKILKTKSAIKTWVLTGMLSPMAYQFDILFKQNTANIRTKLNFSNK